MADFYDLATALDTPLNHPRIESKYQTLRLFSAKKIKSLMGSIDIQVKKLKEYKDAPSDGRTATIQALKKKLRDQEFIADVLKEEVRTKKSISARNVNDNIISETIGGPKRFRQLTREEIENNLADLEVQEKQMKAEATSAPQQSRGKQASSSSSRVQGRGAGSSAGSNSAERGDIESRREVLLSERKRYEDVAAEQIAQIEAATSEMDRIRSRNCDLKSQLEMSALQAKDIEAMLAAKERLEGTLEDALARLASARSELAQTKQAAPVDRDSYLSQIERATAQCSKAVSQNNVLLQRMKVIEDELNSLIEDPLAQVRANASRDLSGVSGEETDEYLEELYARLSKQLEESESRRAALEVQSAEVDALREELRARNEEAREVRRSMAEVARLRLEPAKVKPAKTTAAAEKK
jgi:hypothetical protein